MLSHKWQWPPKHLESSSKLTREQLSRKISRGRKRRRTWKAVRSQTVPRYLTFQSNQLRRKEVSLLPTKERFCAGCFWITQLLYTHRLAHRAQKTVIPGLGATVLSAFCFLSASPALAKDQNKGWETAASYRPKRLRGHLAQGFQCQLCLQISREPVEETECAPQTCVRSLGCQRAVQSYSPAWGGKQPSLTTRALKEVKGWPSPRPDTASGWKTETEEAELRAWSSTSQTTALKTDRIS